MRKRARDTRPNALDDVREPRVAVQVQVPLSVYQRLARIARERGATPNMTIVSMIEKEVSQ